MAVSLETLRGYGSRRIIVHSSAGSFDGSIVPQQLSERSVLLLFALYDHPETQVAIDLDDISEIVER